MFRSVSSRRGRFAHDSVGRVREPASLRHLCGRAVIAILVSGLGWGVAAASDGEAVARTSLLHAPSGLPPAYLLNVPPEAAPVAPVLDDLVKTFQSLSETHQHIKQLRNEQDGLRTKLAAVTSELSTRSQDRQQLEQQLKALEQQQQGRLLSLQKDLETKLTQELAQAQQQIDQELQQDSARQLQAFEARQRDAIEKSLGQELSLKERELAQLSQEIEVQTQELTDRLGRLEVNQDLTQSLDRSMTTILAKRKAELEARRKQLLTEREERLAKQRLEFANQLKQQQSLEQKRRLTLKEASLRSAMAELLHKASVEEGGRFDSLRQALQSTSQQSIVAAEHQAEFKVHLEDVGRKLAEETRQLDALEADQQKAMMHLEQVFQKPNPGLREEAIGWFTQAVQQLSPELANQLGPLQQRLVARAEQERQLQERRRMLRERALALQLSREMTAQYQREQKEAASQREAAARKAEALMTRANQFVDRGKFNEALELLAEAQALNPPQLDRITQRREELLAERARLVSQVKATELQRAFAHAMEVFQAGRYEEAIPLFERVIQQEAQTEPSGSSVKEEARP